jgi:hypothetical protein
VNYRLDLVSQHKSTFQNLKSMEQLEMMTKQLIDFSNSHPEQTFQFPMETFENLTKWDELFRFLDRGYCKAKSVLHSHKEGSYVVDNSEAVHCQPSPHHTK